MSVARSRHHPRRRRPSRLIEALLATTLVVAGCGDDSGAGSDDRLPPLVLTTLDGAEVDLAAATGTPQVLNLWATWCAPCRAELPAFDAVAAVAPPTVAIVGVNVGDERESVVSFVEELELDFPQLLDPGADLNAALDITNMPTTIFVAEDGTIVFTHLGAVDADELTDLVEDHLGVTISPS